MNLQIKRGDTLSLTCTDQTAAVTEGGLTGVEIAASIAMGAGSRPLTVDVLDVEAGTFVLSAPASETEKWPVGALRADIKYSVGDVALRSYDFSIFVSERRTP